MITFGILPIFFCSFLVLELPELCGLGKGRNVCIDVNCLVFFEGLCACVCVCFYIFNKQETQTFDCAKKKKTYQSLATHLRNKFSYNKTYVCLIAPGSLIGHKRGTLSCRVLHQRASTVSKIA